jgi:hypothetical protein
MASVEQVLCFVDRQIEAVLTRGALAVAADLLEEDRAAAREMLARLPLGVWSAEVTRVERRGPHTVVKTHFTATHGSFLMITTWHSGLDDRPRVICIDTLDRIETPSVIRRWHRTDAALSA